MVMKELLKRSNLKEEQRIDLVYPTVANFNTNREKGMVENETTASLWERMGNMKRNAIVSSAIAKLAILKHERHMGWSGGARI